MEYFLAIDTETGGLDASQHKLLEIGAFLFDENGKELDKFHAFLSIYEEPEKSCTVTALKINNFLERAHHPDRSNTEIAKIFAAWSIKVCNEYKPTLLGQNISFDKTFINTFMTTNGFPGWSDIFSYHMMDTCMLGRILSKCGLLKTERFSLKNLCDELDIKIEGAHTAMADARATALVYIKGMRLLKSAVNGSRSASENKL